MKKIAVVNLVTHSLQICQVAILLVYLLLHCYIGFEIFFSPAFQVLGNISQLHHSPKIFVFKSSHPSIHCTLYKCTVQCTCYHLTWGHPVQIVVQ